MFRYEFLMFWLLPLALPVLVAGVAAYLAKSRWILIVTVIVAALWMAWEPPPRVYSDGPYSASWDGQHSADLAESERRFFRAFYAGFATTVILLLCSEAKRGIVALRTNHKRFSPHLDIS